MWGYLHNPILHKIRVSSFFTTTYPYFEILEHLDVCQDFVSDFLIQPSPEELGVT